VRWFRMDDGFYRHEKVRSVGGPEPLSLWFVALACCSEGGTGVLASQKLADAAHFAFVDLEPALSALMAAGLVHNEKTIRKCRRCLDAVSALPTRRLRNGMVYFHDWPDYSPDRMGKRSAVEIERDARRKQLIRNTRLVGAIRARDKGRCRYCGIEVSTRPGDRRSATSPQFDHVYPDSTDGPKQNGNSLDNVVIACGACNQRKGNRSPEQAEMRLLPAPGAGYAGDSPPPKGVDADSTSPPMSTGTGLVGDRYGEVGGQIVDPVTGEVMGPVPIDHDPPPESTPKGDAV